MTATASEPTSRERRILESALAEYRTEFQSDAEAAKKLIATGTTPVPVDLAPPELAAYTALANVILNLDEVITKE